MDFVQAMSSDNITMTAMKEAFTRNSGRKASTVFSFSSAYKYSGAVFGEEQLVLGAPEFILRDAYSQYAAQIEGYGAQGYRVLVFARYLGKLEGGALTAPVEALGFVLLSNPVRKGAKDTFHYFAKQGVEVKVISGDNPVTVSEVAKQAGIAHAERYVDAATLSTKMDYQDAVKNYTVFGRVTPNQKRELVWALKDAGKTVAMTGDGVNDVLALKDADCSVAMASGSEAAAQVAQLVLLESDFSKMPAVVLEGRRVVNNIQRSASLFLVKNIFSLLLSLFSVFFMLDYPLEPSQISLISMFTIGIPSFILALEPNKNMIKGHFLTNVLLKSLPAGLTDFFVVLGLVLFCREFNITGQDVSTCCTILLAIVGFMILHTIASPMTKMHWALLICMIGGWLFCMIFVSHLFAITGITKQCGMLLVIFAIITEPVLRYLSLLVRKLRGLYLKYRATQKRKMQAR
jgi:cation-transporting ATPase E